ncbi:hypothetical protein C0584_01515 [Candidatus Parcubacteria bacterium]|nr:MAG: hypothetical protein C0584_01515 [Candidatus Parcubacteria bacterium]
MSDAFKNLNISKGKRALSLIIYKYSNLLAIFLLLIILLISFQLIIKPKYDKMKNTSVEIEKRKTEEIDKLETYLAQLKSFNKSYNEVSDNDKERMSRIIPGNGDYEDLMAEFENIVNKRNLILRSVEIKKTGAAASNKRVKVASNEEGATSLPEGIKEIILSLSIEGADYDTFKRLMEDFEKNLRITDVKKIDFIDKGRVSLDVSVYYYDL